MVILILTTSSFSHSVNSFKSFWRSLLELPIIPHLFLLVAGLGIGVFVMRADLWIGSYEIFQADSGAIPQHNWLPGKLWSISQHFFAGELMGYFIWNALAIWLLGIGVYQVARQFFSLTETIAPSFRTCAALLAGLLAQLHPLTGMTACSMIHLDWQLATIFSLGVAYYVRTLIDKPCIRYLVPATASLILAALSAPVGVPLSLGVGLMVWKLTPSATQQEFFAWAGARKALAQSFSALGITSIAMVCWWCKKAWETHSHQLALPWPTHWLTQGRVLWLEIKGALFPTHLLPNHALPLSESWADWPALAGLILIVSAALVLIRFLSRNAPPPRNLIYTLALLALLPNMLMLGWRTSDPISEARWHAALPWAAMAVALVIGWLHKHWNALSIPFALAIPSVLGFLSIGQMSHFRHADALANFTLKYEPHNLRIISYLQQIREERGELTEVPKLSQPAEKAYLSMVHYNNTNPMRRRFDLLNAMRWWVQTERRIQSALRQNFGPEYAEVYAEMSSNKFTAQLRELAQTHPDAQALLSKLLPPAPTPPIASPRLPQAIPGVLPTAVNERSNPE